MFLRGLVLTVVCLEYTDHMNNAITSYAEKPAVIINQRSSVFRNHPVSEEKLTSVTSVTHCLIATCQVGVCRVLSALGVMIPQLH